MHELVILHKKHEHIAGAVITKYTFKLACEKQVEICILPPENDKLVNDSDYHACGSLPRPSCQSCRDNETAHIIWPCCDHVLLA